MKDPLRKQCSECMSMGYPVDEVSDTYKCTNCGHEWESYVEGRVGEICPQLKAGGKLTQDEALALFRGGDSMKASLLRKVSKDGLDWNGIAKEAVALYLTGKYTQEKIAKHFGVKLSQLLKYVDLADVRMRVQGDVAANIYKLALEGDKDMTKFVAERQMGWNNKTEVEHKGEINLRPVLNIGVKKLDETNKPDVEIDGPYNPEAQEG